MATPVIYKIINTINNRFYIGGTQSFESRRKVHKQRLRQNKHHAKGLQEDWNVYGEQAFVFVIVQSVPTVEGLKAAENEWLSPCVGTDICYNVGRYADSPWRGVHGPSHPLYSREVPAETREKIRQIMAKKYSDDPLCHPRLGKKHSEETRKKISEKVLAAGAKPWLGKTRDAATREKIGAAQRGVKKAPRVYTPEGLEKMRIAARNREYKPPRASFADVLSKFPAAVQAQYDFSNAQYFGALVRIEGCICPVHGVFSQYAAQFRKGSGCPSCGRAKRSGSGQTQLMS